MGKQDAESVENFYIWMSIHLGKRAVNIPTLKEYVGDIIKMAVQKSSGQHSGGPKTHLDWDNCERVRMSVIGMGCAIADSAMLDKIDFEVERDREFEKEYPTWDFMFDEKYKKWDFRKSSTYNFIKPEYAYFGKENYETMKRYTSRLKNYFAGDMIKQNGETLNLKEIKSAILCETVSLVLSGKLEELNE